MNALRALLLVALAATSVACSGGDESPVEKYGGGDPATYQRILALTDCDALYEEGSKFAGVAENFTGRDEEIASEATRYLRATSDRMQALGCA